MNEKIYLINTSKGEEQRDRFREELLRKADEETIKQKDSLINDILLTTYNNVRRLSIEELQEICMALKNKNIDSDKIENTTNERGLIN